MTTVTIKGSNMTNVTYIKQNRVLTDSRKLAEDFGKRHDDVLRKIKKQLEDLPEEFTDRNFAVSDYRDPTGRTLPVYEMTKDGFMAIGMTFTGKTAAAFRVGVIEEFNRRGDELEKRGLPTLSMEEILQRSLDKIREQANTIKLTQDRATDNVLDHALTSNDIVKEFQKLSVIANDWVNVHVKNGSKFRLGGRVTIWLKEVYGLTPVVRIVKKPYDVAAFNRADIERVVREVSGEQ